jgi:hypothetical protein
VTFLRLLVFCWKYTPLKLFEEHEVTNATDAVFTASLDAFQQKDLEKE